MPMQWDYMWTDNWEALHLEKRIIQFHWPTLAVARRTTLYLATYGRILLPIFEIGSHPRTPAFHTLLNETAHCQAAYKVVSLVQLISRWGGFENGPCCCLGGGEGVRGSIWSLPPLPLEYWSGERLFGMIVRGMGVGTNAEPSNNRVAFTSKAV